MKAPEDKPDSLTADGSALWLPRAGAAPAGYAPANTSRLPVMLLTAIRLIQWAHSIVAIFSSFWL